jgi:hypothetical protein
MRGRDLMLHAEPRLADMLEDPVIQAVMTRDRVARTEILDLVLSVRSRLGMMPDMRAEAAAA